MLTLLKRGQQLHQLQNCIFHVFVDMHHFFNTCVVPELSKKN